MNIINVVLSVFVMSFAIILTVSNLSQTKITLKKMIIYYIIIFSLLLLINLYFDGLVKLILVIIAITISLYFSIFNKKLGDSLYYALIYDFLAFIVEVIISIMAVSLFNFNIESYNNFSLSVFIFSILNSLGTYLISKIKKFNNFTVKLNKTINKKKYEIFYIIIIFFLLVLLILFNRNNLEKDLSFYINAGMITFVFLTLLYIIYNDFQNDKLENNYNEMMDYVCKYEKIINDQGKKNHEYNNQLMVIKGYSHNPKKLEEYLNLIIDEHKCGQNYTIRELSYFPDGGIKGLIYHKISKMEDKKIKYFLYIDKNTKNIFEDKFDLKTYQDITKLLGVFLDNAIEATLEADPKEIELEIKNDEDSSIITISNTYNKNQDISKIGKKGFTTKGVGHGYGLSIVKDISKNNDNIETFNNVEDDKFKQTIIIYYKK